MANHSSTLAWKIHGQRSLVGCSPWGHTESDMTERPCFHFSLWCIGEGNGNPLQCSCLEKPRDGGAWWAAVYGVAQSRTQLKQLSSSSSIPLQAVLFYSDAYTKGLKPARGQNWKSSTFEPHGRTQNQTPQSPQTPPPNNRLLGTGF